MGALPLQTLRSRENRGLLSRDYLVEVFSLKAFILTREKESEEAAVPQIVYASHAEALEAFHEILNNKKVSANAKMKEVLDLCQNDPRWDSLKILSQGDKKQGLAEYQVLPLIVIALRIRYKLNFPCRYRRRS